MGTTSSAVIMASPPISLTVHCRGEGATGPLVSSGIYSPGYYAYKGSDPDNITILENDSVSFTNVNATL